MTPRGYDDEYYPEETDWTENCYETSDYDNTDSTFSEHTPAFLDQPFETQEGDTSARSSGCGECSTR